MESLFSDTATREKYAIMLTEWIIQIYGVVDNTEKKNIFSELQSLDDENLLAKGDAIEKYFESVKHINDSHLYKLISAENDYLSKQEREEVALAF